MKTKIKDFISKFYIIFILLIVYLPLFFSFIFSFTKPKKRGDISFDVLNWFSMDGYKELFDKDQVFAILNSFLIGIVTAIVVTFLGLLVVFGLWKQKRNNWKTYVNLTSHIPLINPDIVSAALLSIAFTTIFGTLTFNTDGILRAIVSHIVLILPYAIILLYSRSEKFSPILFEASNDLGYNNIQTWFKIYLRFMMPSIFISLFVCLALSFDDFIITRTVSSVQTIGTKMYSESIKGWTLAIGSILLIVVLIITSIKIIWEKRKNIRKEKNVKKIMINSNHLFD